MSKLYHLLFLLSFSCFFAQTSSFLNEEEYFFQENKGQILDQNGKANAEVLYLFNSHGLNVQLRKNGFSYDVFEEEILKDQQPPNKSELFKPSKPETKIRKRKNHRVDINFVGASPTMQIVGENPSDSYDNFYNIPNRPEGVTFVRKYQRVVYKDLYPKVDLVFFKPTDRLKPIEYNFIVHPGGKVSDIKMKFSGAKTSLAQGKLKMKVRFGEMHESIPESWTEDPAQTKSALAVNYRDLGKQTFGFVSPLKDSPDKTIVIDPIPTRIWGTYFGGDGIGDWGMVRTDKMNNGYIYGTTDSQSIASVGTNQQASLISPEAFILKFDKNGKKLWGTFYRSNEHGDSFTALNTDDEMNVYAVSLATPVGGGRYQRNVIVKYSKDGIKVFDKLFGADGGSEALDVAYHNNTIYVAGHTFAVDSFATSNAYKTIRAEGWEDGYLGSFSAIDGKTNWITFVGGQTGPSQIHRIFSFEDGIELAGITRAPDIELKDPFDFSPGVLSAGVYFKFAEDGHLIQSSYIGSDNDTNINERFYKNIEARRIGNLLAFATVQLEYPVDPSQYRVLLSSYLADTTTKKLVEQPATIDITDYHEFGVDTYMDRAGNIYLAGNNGMNDPKDLEKWIPTPNAYLSKATGTTINFYEKFDPRLNKVWGTLFPGQQLPGITGDNEGFLYFWGWISVPDDIATPGALQPEIDEANDLYIAKLADCESFIEVTASPTCVGDDLQLHVEGGSSYEWFGPNGFSSHEKDPIIKNAQRINSGRYYVRVGGDDACGGIFTVKVNIGSDEPPIPDFENLPDINAVCEYDLQPEDYPTATDACGVTIVGKLADGVVFPIKESTVITWEYVADNGEVTTQEQQITIDDIPEPTVDEEQIFCKLDAPTVSDLKADGENLQWYDAQLNPLTPDTELHSGIYYVSQTMMSCTSYAETEVIVNDTPEPVLSAPAIFCIGETATLADIQVQGQNLQWYDAAGNSLDVNHEIKDGETYWVTQTLDACESLKTEVTVSFSNQGLQANDVADSFCDNEEGTAGKAFDLTRYQAEMTKDFATYQFEYFDDHEQPISSIVDLKTGENLFFVKITSDKGCSTQVQLQLVLNELPQTNLPEEVEICEGSSTILDADNDPDQTYLWNTGATTSAISVTEEGTYTVEITNATGCSVTKSVTVSFARDAQVQSIDIKGKTATVILTSTGNFEYSLDQINWQHSNVFENLQSGNYMVFVRNAGGCIVDEKAFAVFNIPNAFSPNGDGKNDTWKIPALSLYPGSKVQVFDRYGNPVFETVVKDSFEWDGKMMGRPLPTATYWYVIQLTDGRVMTGSVLLMNRN